MLVVEEEQGVAWRGAAGAGEDRDDVGVAVGVEVSGEEKFVGDCWDLIGDGEGAVAAAEGGDEIAGGADGEDVGEAVAVEVGGDKAGGKGADLTGETGGADGEIGESLEVPSPLPRIWVMPVAVKKTRLVLPLLPVV
jgi:hypothetical protein